MFLKVRAPGTVIYSNLAKAFALRWPATSTGPLAKPPEPLQMNLFGEKGQVIWPPGEKSRPAFRKAAVVWSLKTTHVWSLKTAHVWSLKTARVWSLKTAHVWSLKTAHVWSLKTAHCLVSQDSTCLVSQDSTCQGCQKHQKIVVSGTNVVAMARHGPILKDSEATGSGKVFRYLPGLRDITTKIENGCRSPKIQKHRILPYIPI